MTTPDGPPRPIPVHIASVAPGTMIPGAQPDLWPGAPDNRPRITPVFRTWALTAGVPEPIAADDRSRLRMRIIAYGNSVVLCSSQSQAQDPANAVASAALGAAFANTPGNPQGTLLFVPVLIGPPVNSQPSVWWETQTTEVVWAVSMAAALLAITIENQG